jgi:hypothetical protein
VTRHRFLSQATVELPAHVQKTSGFEIQNGDKSPHSKEKRRRKRKREISTQSDPLQAEGSA